MKETNPISIRIPPEVKSWLKARAEANSRTMNGEILALLKAQKQAEPEKGPA